MSGGRRPKFAGGVTFGALAKAAFPLAGNLASSYTRSSLSKAPAFITWALTERCPLRCKHCDMGSPTPELNRKERIDLAHRLAATDVWGFSLIGGEASMIPELGDLIAILKEAGKYVSVGTSGFRIDRHLQAFCELGLDSITFSVDSHIASEHDTFRRRPGLFDEVSAAICWLNEHRLKGRPQVQLRCTMHRQNYQNLDATIDYWSPKVDNVLLQLIQDNGIHAVRDKEVMFQAEDRIDFEAVIKDLRERYPKLKTRYFELASRYIFEPEQLYKDIGFRCLLVPGVSCVVMPDGGVKLCYGRQDSVIGNLKESTLQDIWTAEHTRSTTKRMQSKEYGCMCWEQACSGNLDLLPVNRQIERVFGR